MEVEAKQNDTSRSIQDTLMIGSTLIDLTGTSIKALFKLDGVLVEQVANYVGDPTTGVVRADLPASVVSIEGRWSVEWEITYANLKQLTVPTRGYNVLIVNPDLNTVA